MTPPTPDDVGKYFEKGQPLCSVGDLDHLRVVMPVTPADYRVLERDLAEDWRNGSDLDVTIRIHGRAERTWHGKLSKDQLPESEAKDIPVQLTNKGGGNIAINPSAKPERNQTKPDRYPPQDQQYLVGVDILDSDGAIAPGTLADVKVHCHWRTAVWSAWRWFSTKFDLGMDLPSFIPSFKKTG